MISIDAKLVNDFDVFSQYRDGFQRHENSLAIWPERDHSSIPIVSFMADRLILTAGFVTIDPVRNFMIINQSYSNIDRIFPHKFSFKDGRYVADIEPIFIPGRSVVIGGPIDGVWYHWLFSWCPRMLLMQMLRPDLMADPKTKFIVHPAALNGPFGETLATFGIPQERILALDLAKDYELEEAVIVPFLDQNRLYPDIIKDFKDHLIRGLGVRPNVIAKRRVFTSRQALPAPKRRIENFDEVRSLLEEDFQFTVNDMSRMKATQQVKLFAEAEIVVGAHGSDLTNLLFCRPGTKVIVIESAVSVEANLHRGLEYLCEVLQLEYYRVEADLAPYPGRDDSNLGQLMRSDYIVNVDKLRSMLASIGLQNKNKKKFRGFFSFLSIRSR